MAQKQYKFLNPEFLDIMDQIGEYGNQKYGAESFHQRALLGDRSRGTARVMPEAICEHAKEHCDMYLRGELHDKFGTREHQLAAVAFNAMMEFYFAQNDVEYGPQKTKAA